jgi:hypothetical protein
VVDDFGASAGSRRVAAKELETAEAMAVTEPMTSAADIETSVRRRLLPWPLD